MGRIVPGVTCACTGASPTRPRRLFSLTMTPPPGPPGPYPGPFIPGFPPVPPPPAALAYATAPEPPPPGSGRGSVGSAVVAWVVIVAVVGLIAAPAEWFDWRGA